MAKTVENRLLDAVLGSDSRDSTRESFRSMLQNGELDDRIIDVDIPLVPPGSGGSPGKLGSAFDKLGQNGVE